MDFMLLTQNSTPIFKYVVKLLGLIMNGIFEFLNLIGIPNIGLSIILFTIVIYLLLITAPYCTRVSLFTPRSRSFASLE